MKTDLVLGEKYLYKPNSDSTYAKEATLLQLTDTEAFFDGNLTWAIPLEQVIGKAVRPKPWYTKLFVALRLCRRRDDP